MYNFTPRFPLMCRVLYNHGTIFIGNVVSTYRSRNGVIKCVVECDAGLTFITEEKNLERLSYPRE